MCLFSSLARRRLSHAEIPQQALYLAYSLALGYILILGVSSGEAGGGHRDKKRLRNLGGGQKGPGGYFQVSTGSTSTLMDAVGHFPMSENPVAFTEYLLPVLKQIEVR